jgi:hypothetical protein
MLIMVFVIVMIVMVVAVVVVPMVVVAMVVVVVPVHAPAAMGSKRQAGKPQQTDQSKKWFGHAANMDTVEGSRRPNARIGSASLALTHPPDGRCLWG